MIQIEKLKYGIYKIASLLIHSSILSFLGRLKLWGRMKQWLMGSAGTPNLTSGEIFWEDIQFSFSAPFKVFDKARHNGIENGICRLARKILLEDASPSTVIDVGANYGFVSLVMGKSMNDESYLISVEADAYIASVLKETLSENNLQDRCMIVNKIASAQVSDHQITLDSLTRSLSCPPVRFVKIDVDGGDYQVLLGARSLLEKYHPVVVIEMSDFQSKIFTELKSIGYQYFIDQSNQPAIDGKWPLNLIASFDEVYIPGHFV